MRQGFNDFELKVSNYLDRVDKNDIAVTVFLDPAQQNLLLSKAKGYQFYSYGGFNDAERVLVVLSKEKLTNAQVKDTALISAIKLTWGDKQAVLTHRDFLGALLALGIKRETIGDILVEKDYASIFTTQTIGTYIIEQFTEVKNIVVHCELVKPDDLLPPAREYEEHDIIIASMRIDCIIAALIKLPRKNASEMIISGAVKVNHIVCKKTDFLLNCNDLISVRGYGRYLLSEIGGRSRKDRIFIKIKKYV